MLRPSVHARRIALTIATMFPLLDGSLDAQRARPTPVALTPTELAWEFRALDGTRTSLASFRGRVVVLNAWATWCEPCVAELQSLYALQRSLRDTSVVIVLVSPERAEPVRRFLTRRALPMRAYLEWSKAPAVFEFSAVPMTWILDPDGRLVLRHRGARRWDTPEVRALLDSLRSD